MTILENTLNKTLPDQSRVGQLDTQISKYEKQYQPNMLSDFRKLLQKSSRLAYDKRKSQEKPGFNPSEVSGQTFASIVGDAEQRRGASVSDIYKTGVYGQVESQKSIGDMLESLRGERETLLTNRTDFIQKLALNSPATLNALGGKGIESILNGSEITPEMYTTIGDAVKTTVKPTAGELDQEEISRVSDLLVDPEGTQGKPRNGIDSFVSQGYYNQVKAQSNISPSEFDKRFEYLVEGGEISGFGVANQIISDNPTSTDEELKVSLLKVKDELDLSVTDINAMINGRSQQGDMYLSDTQLDSIAQSLVGSIGKEEAIKAVVFGKIKIEPEGEKSQEITLSTSQIVKLRDMINESKPEQSKPTYWQKGGGFDNLFKK